MTLLAHLYFAQRNNRELGNVKKMFTNVNQRTEDSPCRQ